MAAVDTASRVGTWIEGSRNPFLVREWRRSRRNRSSPFVGPMLVVSLAVLLTLAVAGATLGLLGVLIWQGEPGALSPSILGSAMRFVGVLLLGGLAWSMIYMASWLAAAQTWQEERQATLELLLAAPLSRSGIVGYLLGWPLLNVALYLVPLLPLVACLMPFLGLSFWGALRTLAVMLGVCLLVMVRAPSGAAIRATRGTARRTVSQLLGTIVAVLWLTPVLGALAKFFLGLDGLGLVRWPVTVGELLVRRADFWAGATHLGWWLGAIFLLLLAQRWLVALGRLAEGSEVRPIPDSAVALPMWLVLIYLVSGLWWGHGLATTGLEQRLWTGLHLVVALFLISTFRQAADPVWHGLWWLSPRLRSPLALAAARLVDLLLVVAAAPALWYLGTHQAGLAVAAPAWSVTGEAAVVAVVLAGLAELQRRARAGRPAAAPDGAAGNTVNTLVVLVLIAWVAQGFAVFSSSPSGSWTKAFFGWPRDATWMLLAAGLLLLWGPALAASAAVAGRQRPDLADTLLAQWRIFPAAWQANPLATKARRAAARRGLGQALPWAMALLGLAGLIAPLVVHWLGPRATTASAGQWVVLVMVALLSEAGQTLGGHLGSADLSPVAGAMLAQVVASAALLGLPLVLLSATLTGRVVTEERLAGSLGFLLLCDLSDRDLAEGFLVGHLYPILEVLAGYAVVLVLWAVVAWSWLVAVAALILLVFVVGAVQGAAAVALLGNARYEARANGTAYAVGGMLVFHVTACGLAALAVAMADLPDEWWNDGTLLVAAGGWSLVSLVTGRLLWGECPGAIRRLRVVGRLWRAFEPVSQRE